MNKKQLIILIALIAICSKLGLSQSISYEDFFNNFASFYNQNKEQAKTTYNNFREKANQEYIEFLKKAWGDYDKFSPLPNPKEENPIPPRPYEEQIEENPISVVPDEVPIVVPRPQPQPIEPIQEFPQPIENRVLFNFYGLNENVRIPEFANISVKTSNIENIAEAWNTLCDEAIDITIYDVLELRDKYNLSDWAYLQLLETIANKYCSDKNGATLLMAFLYCQSGYQMRLAQDRGKLYMLFGSQHQIFNKGYFVVEGETFYPVGEPSNSIRICAAAFKGETPLSLLISNEQKLGATLSERRTITSERYSDTRATSQVPKGLIHFFNTYPTSAIGGNVMTRWAMYANTPLAEKTKEQIYPALKKSIDGDSALEAANKLLNWVQTGFVYEYDDVVWGHDRAFFAEETLFYPYCDCEDRSILYSRLIRDLLGLDVALIYYPGHLATAVKFDSEVQGDAMLIDGKKYIVCDPTYIGAPVGKQMPDLEYAKAQAIVLER